MVTGKPIALVYARGGAYGAETGAQGYDLQSSYMNLALQFIGFSDIRQIIVEPMLMAEVQQKVQIIAAAKQQAQGMAATF
jgi:FMN-dependent NADH-azoreductase